MKTIKMENGQSFRVYTSQREVIKELKEIKRVILDSENF
jgi:uncharacterized protein YlzI (FlbEa/FlbD family)